MKKSKLSQQLLSTFSAQIQATVLALKSFITTDSGMFVHSMYCAFLHHQLTNLLVKKANLLSHPNFFTGEYSPNQSRWDGNQFFLT
jgi:hypothetical protein